MYVYMYMFVSSNCRRMMCLVKLKEARGVERRKGGDTEGMGSKRESSKRGAKRGEQQREARGEQPREARGRTAKG